jgi:photosystem II stability/assembly factor-like uncharacterized protein/dienelactone hydrolase
MKIAHLTLLLFITSFCFAQELPRKLWLGLKTQVPNDSILKAVGLSEATGLLVTEVNEHGSGAKLKINDVLLKINNIVIKNKTDLQNRDITSLVEGQAIQFQAIRNKKPITINTTVAGRLKENHPALSYTYTSVQYDDGQLNAIISKPKGVSSKLPAVLFIQGYTCTEMVDMPNTHPYKKLCDELSAKGFVVMRVEKPGMGNSLNTPACDEIDYPQELKAFDNALLSLKNNSDVDTKNIFVWGHSLGGILGPALTAKYNWIKGIITYGTLAQVWNEYYTKMLREQGKGFGVKPVELENSVRAGMKILYETHVQKKSIVQLSQEDPILIPFLKSDFGWDGKTEKFNTRSLAYMQTLNEQNTMENWTKTNAKVLTMFGEADIEVMDSTGAKDITDAVNLTHPNNATYYFVPGTDHSFAKVGTMADGYKAKGMSNYYQIMSEKYNPDIANISVGWMQYVMDTTKNMQQLIRKNINPFQWEKLSTDAYKGKQDDIYFTDEYHGWYGNGSGKIYATKDAGKTWNKVLDKEGYYVRCLAFIDSLHGFAGNVGTDYFPGVTDTTCMLETFDGGLTWQAVTNITGPYPKGLCAIDIQQKLFINAGNPMYKNTIRAAGRVGSPAFMMTSVDNGKSWMSRDMSMYTKMIFDIKFLNEKEGFICGATSEETEKAHAQILKTTDGGATWKTVYESSRPFELTWKCSFPTDQTGYVTIQSYNTDEKTSQRYVAKTTDGGNTWKELPLDKNLAIREFGVLFINEQLGFIGSTTGGYQTNNGGETWFKTDFGKYTNKFRIVNTKKGKRVIGIGSEVWTLDVQ